MDGEAVAVIDDGATKDNGGEEEAAAMGGGRLNGDDKLETEETEAKASPEGADDKDEETEEQTGIASELEAKTIEAD